MPLLGRDLITVDDLTDPQVEALLDVAARWAKETTPQLRRLLQDRIVAMAFFEPSTRTRLSFEAAAHRLGAAVIGFSEAGTTSAKKGERLEDTARMLAGYADLVVVRHPDQGSARRMADAVDVPVVNAGDGSGDHPTQALMDLYTIRQERGRFDDHTVALVGDLKNGRTVHSLAVLLARFGNRLLFVAPPGLEMPDAVVAACKKHGAAVKTTRDLQDATQEADVIYMTRLQTERFADPEQAKRFAGSYDLTPHVMDKARKDVTILHPLPRVDEIPTTVDTHPGAAYFRQARNGVPVRMSILAHLLSETEP